MAIVVKGKKCLCKTSLSDWNPERVNGVWFYNRYQEFVKLFSAKIPEVDFEKCFAQPVLNEETMSIEWFCLPMNEPCTLNEVPDESAEKEKKRIITAIEKAVKSLSESDRKYLNPILSTLQSDKVDTITYHQDGQVVFGIWGMMMKKGKVIADVIIDDIKDHRIHHITYKVRGRGKIDFSNIVRRHGHVLAGKDVPQCIPANGYIVKEWIPDSPFGKVVDKELSFTIVIEKDPNAKPEDDELDVTDNIPNDETNNFISQDTNNEENNIDNTDEILPPPEPEMYNVKFVSDNRGVLNGETKYLKKDGEHILTTEIPRVVPKEGFRFIGWDTNPVDYIVTEDTVFTAQFEPIDKEEIVEEIVEDAALYKPTHKFSGCLNWLLALLLLALIGFLLWFLLGNHGINFCGCNCNETIIIQHDTVFINDTVSPPLPPEQLTPCNELTSSGANIPETHIFNMGQKNGTFIFEYATGDNISDHIVIYDGTSKQDRIIFDFYGATGDCYLLEKTILNFNNQYVLVDIVPDPSNGTCWTIKVNCPK